MKALIVLNGCCPDPEYYKQLMKETEYLISADGGFRHIKACGFSPDLMVGDFDSCSELPSGCEIIRFPAEKDDTDAEIALKEAVKRGADEVAFTCALGGRVDHELANLFLLRSQRSLGIPCSIRESQADIFFVDGRFELSGDPGTTVSILPIRDAEVSLHGFYYPLDHFLLEVGTSRGMSNLIQQSPCYVDIHQGEVLVFVNKSNSLA